MLGSFSPWVFRVVMLELRLLQEKREHRLYDLSQSSRKCHAALCPVSEGERLLAS